MAQLSLGVFLAGVTIAALGPIPEDAPVILLHPGEERA